MAISEGIGSQYLFDNLYPISKKDLKDVCRVLANAFSEDPIIKKMGLENEEIITLYEIPIKTALRYDKVFATSENLEGIIAFVLGMYGNMKMRNIIRSGAIIPALKLGMKYGKMMQQMADILEED